MRLSVLSMLCDVLTLAVIGTVVLSAVSCRSQQHIEARTEMREDSLREVSTESVTVETVLQAVRGDTASLTVPMEVMKNLPDGAVFTLKQGRTRVSLKRDGDNVVAEAESDSIGREVKRYERRARDALRCAQYGESSKQPEKRMGLLRQMWLLGLMGLLGLIGYIVIRKRLK